MSVPFGADSRHSCFRGRSTPYTRLLGILKLMVTEVTVTDVTISGVLCSHSFPRHQPMSVTLWIYKGRVSQGYWGTREHGQFQLGNRGTKEKYLREQGNKKRFREHGKKKLRKGGQKKDVNGTHLATFPLHLCNVVNIFVSKSVCMQLRQWLNWGMSMNSPWVAGC